MWLRKRRSALFCGEGGRGGDVDDVGGGDRVGGEERDVEASPMSVTDGVLPSLGVTARSSRRIKLRRFIISPFDPRYRCWEAFLVLLVFYTAWACPFEFGFLSKPSPVLAITDNIVNGIFAIDIILTFFVAYLDRVSYLLIDNPKQIAWKYARTWLAFDVISSIPYEATTKILPPPLQSYGYFNILRLWRLRRVSKLFARLEKDRKYSYIRVRYFKLSCVTLFIVHCAGCFFYFLAEHYPEPEHTWIGQVLGNFKQRSLFVKYVTTIYWSITTLSTTGYGDIHPANTRERLFDIFYMFINLGLLSYLLGNMNNLVIHGTMHTRKFRDTIEAASSFAKRNQLPGRLHDQMLANLCLRYRTDSEGLHQQEIIDSLPKAIRSSISHFLFYSLVDQVYLFRGVSNDLLFQLVTEMKAEYFPPKEDVILQNEAPTDLYILVTGAVDLIVRKGGIEQIVREAKQGEVVGEVGLLCYKPQLFTVRTKRLSQLLRLNRTAFLNLLRANVGDGTIIMNNLLQHLKDSGDPMMEEILTDTEQKLAQGRTDMPLSLCFAVDRVDDFLLQQLLRRGSDPNELDNSGRTALHFAASKGNQHCVALLIEYGADPNIKDSQGSVPLWEAILGKHESVVKILVENGASISSGDVGHFASTAIERNNLNLLKDIVSYGGDVTQPNINGTTALHTAISAGNVEIVKFLVDQGADIDKPDDHGLTPRALADHQGFEEIQVLFQGCQYNKRSPVFPSPMRQGVPYLGKHVVKYNSEPSMPPYSADFLSPIAKVTSANSHWRRRPDNFQNSLFGLMSAARTDVERDPIAFGDRSSSYPTRVSISCPEKGQVTGKLVLLPKSLQDLLSIGAQKFGFSPIKILTKEGAEIDDINLIRDGDHLILVSENLGNHIAENSSSLDCASTIHGGS